DAGVYPVGIPRNLQVVKDDVFGRCGIVQLVEIVLVFRQGQGGGGNKGFLPSFQLLQADLQFPVGPSQQEAVGEQHCRGGLGPGEAQDVPSAGLPELYLGVQGDLKEACISGACV